MVHLWQLRLGFEIIAAEAFTQEMKASWILKWSCNVLATKSSLLPHSCVVGIDYAGNSGDSGVPRGLYCSMWLFMVTISDIDSALNLPDLESSFCFFSHLLLWAESPSPVMPEGLIFAPQWQTRFGNQTAYGQSSCRDGESVTRGYQVWVGKRSDSTRLSLRLQMMWDASCMQAWLPGSTWWTAWWFSI